VAYDPLTAEGPGVGLDHPPSYWAATAGPAPGDDGPLESDRETDVAIVGGGYTGLSAAYHIARMLDARPVVLEANRCGWGCSGRNGGFARPMLGRLELADWIAKWGAPGARALFAEALAGLAETRELIARSGIACDASPPGGLYLAHRPNRIAGLREKQRLLREVFDDDADFLDAETIAAEHFRGAEAFGAMREHWSFGLHPLKLVHGLLRLARGLGVAVHGASPVIGWTRDGNGHVLTTPRARLRARRLVIATNGYTAERLFPPVAGRTLPVLSSIIVTRPMTPEEKGEAGFVSTDVMVDTRKVRHYYRRLPDDRVLFGGRGASGDAPAVQARDRARLLAALKRKFPALRDITADYHWGGWVNISSDFMPRIHRLETDPSVFYAMGYNGTGLAVALLAGRRLAERIAGDDQGVPQQMRGALPRFPLPALRRLGQRAMIQWFRFQDRL